jgi:NAD(P)-dependent dehydrogenase (short-subunit alcohol dehydrogenase family)
MAGCLSSKVVIVTGGSTGIGRAVADRVAAEGGAVVIAGRCQGPGDGLLPSCAPAAAAHGSWPPTSRWSTDALVAGHVDTPLYRD